MPLAFIIQFWMVVGVFGTAIFGKSSKSGLKPALNCDLHQTRQDATPVSSTFPHDATTDWLYPSKQEIESAYTVAKAKCSALLAELQTKNDSDFAPVYINPKSFPSTGQEKCRGRSTLLGISGIYMIPFGPYSECPTYSRCWFGLLSCGTFDPVKLTNITKDAIMNDVKQIIPDTDPNSFPGFGSWSPRSLHIHLRLVGSEIVVPEQRIYTVVPSSGKKEEVIIAQYQLTLPDENYQAEMRLLEFYPSMLVNWPKKQLSDKFLHNAGNIFLGGNEGRCKPWSKCTLSNTCCGCDERSFIADAPYKVVAIDKSKSCGKKLDVDKPLPICSATMKGSSSPAGRWIQSSSPKLTPACAANESYNIFHMHIANHSDYNVSSRSHGTKQAISAHHGNHSNHNADKWKWASGNPCMHAGHEPEELGIGNWFFAPYTCRYHFYTRTQLHQCLDDKMIGHIHFQGDTQTRDFFAVVSRLLGVPPAQEMQLKHLGEEAKHSDVQFHSGSVLLSEGYSWSWNEGLFKQIEKKPLPDVLITNYALVHRLQHPIAFANTTKYTEFKYWKQDRNASLPRPRFMFFQNAKDLHGRRSSTYIGNLIQQDGAILRAMYNQLGFMELDEYQLTAGRLESHSKHSDGWHFGGTAKQMEAMIFFNYLCNDWLAKQSNVDK